MPAKTQCQPLEESSHSILAFSHNATKAFRGFTKEDMLYMMFDMSLQDVIDDFKRFKNLKEEAICKKIAFVIDVKSKSENLTFNTNKDLFPL